MTELERRQGRRLCRNAQGLERYLLDFISDLQDAVRSDDEAWSWGEALGRMTRMREQLNIMRDLVNNTTREMHAARISAAKGVS